MDQNSILSRQRHDVGDGPERDKVEALAQLEIRERPGLEQSVAKFEDDTDAAEIAERGIVDSFRIHDRNASGLAADVKVGIFEALRASVQRKRVLDERA